MPDNQYDEMQQCYHNVFSTIEGQRVMGDILFRLGHFGDVMNPSDIGLVAEYNVAVTIARMSGALDSLYLQLGVAVRKD